MKLELSLRVTSVSIDKTDVSGTITRNPEMHHRAPGQAKEAGMTLGHSTAELEPDLRAMSRSTIETKVSGLVTRGRDGCVSFHLSCPFLSTCP